MQGAYPKTPALATAAVSLECCVWLPVPAICENWSSYLVFLAKPPKESDLRDENEPALHPIHLALEFQKMLERELVNNRSELAKRYGLSRARVTQIMNLLDLAPEIQEHLLQLKDRRSVRALSERRLRGLAQLRSHSAQVRRFFAMVES